MEPRLKESKKWTSLPKELSHQVQTILTENFPEQSLKGQFIFEGRIYPSELILRLGYLLNNTLRQNNFEVSISYISNKENLMTLIHLAADASATLFSSWTEDPDNIPALKWQEFQFENRSFYARYSTVNSQLEAEADKLLGENSIELMNEESEYEDELNHKISLLGLGEEDDEDPSSH